MRRGELESRLLDFVHRILARAGQRIAVDVETGLFEEGVIDSLRILDLIAFVEESTGAKIPDSEVRLANFRSVRAMAAAFGEKGSEPLEDGGSVVHERRALRPAHATSPEELMARGVVGLAASGRAVFRGAARLLPSYFDAVALGWARELGARDHEVPRTLPGEVLARAGCAEPGPPASDPRVPPAVCYHVYRAWEGRRLDTGTTLLTARAGCHRHENGRPPTLERLRDFEMREIVALGPRDEVERFRRGLMTRVWDFVTELDLEARVEVAGDPFFLADRPELAPQVAREVRGRRLMQQVLPLKYELRLALGASGRSCAAASFNHHLDFFGRRFSLRLATGGTAHTGCVALGLERCALAFLCRYGVAERGWPEPVREFVFRGHDHARIA